MYNSFNMIFELCIFRKVLVKCRNDDIQMKHGFFHVVFCSDFASLIWGFDLYKSLLYSWSAILSGMISTYHFFSITWLAKESGALIVHQKSKTLLQKTLINYMVWTLNHETYVSMRLVNKLSGIWNIISTLLFLFVFLFYSNEKFPIFFIINLFILRHLFRQK